MSVDTDCIHEYISRRQLIGHNRIVYQCAVCSTRLSKQDPSVVKAENEEARR